MPEGAYEGEYAIVLNRQTPTGWAKWCRYGPNEIDQVLRIISTSRVGHYCITKRDDP